MEFPKQPKNEGLITLPNGSTVRVNEQGHVEVPQDHPMARILSNETPRAAADASYEITIKVKGNGNPGEAVRSMGIGGNSSVQALTQLPDTYYSSSPVAYENPGDAQPYVAPFEDEASQRAFMMENEEVAEPRSKAALQYNKERAVDTTPYPESGKKRARGKVVLGGMALTAVLLSGPALQTANAGAEVAKACGANPICFAMKTVDNLSPKNLFNYSSPEHK
jgi:hypothetical protein